MLQVDDLVGKEIGKYKIEAVAGNGGQAIVYKAWHRDMQAYVAIKFLKKETAENLALRERFKKEARLQFRLQHAHIVRVIEILEEDSLLGMTMDWIEGMDLEKYLSQTSPFLSYREILRIFLPVLSGVEHAHRTGIVHRDLKPSNILLHGEKGEEIPKVMDFGIAKSLEPTENHTKTGSLLGTPSYIAPEQIASTKDVDHRADIYALGIALYQIISFHLPFEGKDLLQTISAHLFEKPPAFSAWNVDVDPVIEAVVMKAIEKEPANRFASCKEFAQALEYAVASASQAAPSSSSIGLLSTLSASSGQLPTAIPLTSQREPSPENPQPADTLEPTSSLTTPPTASTPASQPQVPPSFASSETLPLTTPLPSASSASPRQGVVFALGALALLLVSALGWFLLFRPSSAPSTKPTDPRKLASTLPTHPPQPRESLPKPEVQPHPSPAASPSPVAPPSPVSMGSATPPEKEPTHREQTQPPIRSRTPEPAAKNKSAFTSCRACLRTRFIRELRNSPESPCSLSNLQRAALLCRQACQYRFDVFCRSFGQLRPPQNITSFVSKKLSTSLVCINNIRSKAQQIARYAHFPPNEQKKSDQCIKAFLKP